jgi:nucleotide-binding universal stress UspA family protein
LTATAPVRKDPGTEQQHYERILLASEGRPISDAAIDRAAELAASSGASVHVFSVARVHGVSFGMQVPGLLPTKREWEEQRQIVAKAVKRLKRKGVAAKGHVLGTRKATKRIIQEAAKEGCDAIVMTADPDRGRIVGDMMWSQEPQRVRRKARVPVFLVAGEE